MYFTRFASLLAVGMLSGCTSVPDLPEQRNVRVDDVVNRINCELYEGASRAKFLSEEFGWAAGTDLKLQVVALASANLSLNFGTPLNPGSLVVAMGGGYSGSADRTAGLKFATNMDEPAQIRCNDLPGQSAVQVAGNLGIIDWIEMLQATRNSSLIKMTEFSYELKFTIVKSGNLGPTFTAVPLGSSTIGGGLAVAGTRTNVHTLKIGFTKNQKPSVKGGKLNFEDAARNSKFLETLTNPKIELLQ